MMASIDEIFKQSGASGTAKRKFDAVHDPNELYKAAKLGTNGDVKNKGKAVAVEDEEEESEFAGPELPPDFDEEEIPDDEEGRFFGGGMDRETAQAMEYLDQRDKDDGEVPPDKIDVAWVRRLALNFEKRISKNAELRAKFENDPQKFMASEADLDSDIKALSVLSEHPELYEEFSQLGCVASLVSLLSHENTDIAIDAIQTISELTDEDIEAEQGQWDSLVNAMLDTDLVELLSQNLSRLDESSESDRGGVYYVLNVLENLASQSTVADKIGKDRNVMPWLLNRIQQKESPVSQNKQYAAEVLAILLQSSADNGRQFIAMDGVDALLQLLSAYRKRDPERNSDEEEYVENLFDCLTCIVDEDDGKVKFVEGEGIELAQIMIREGQGGVMGCERLVEVAGLRTMFGMFMKKQENETIEHLLGIFASLLRHLPGGSAARIRTLAKFMEKNYEKIGKLVTLRKQFAARLSPVEKEIEGEKASLDEDEQEEMAGDWLSRRLDAGLFPLQTIDIILSWLVAEDDGARTHISSLLADQDEDLSVVKRSLQEQLEGLDEDGGSIQDQREMLSTLLQFL